MILFPRAVRVYVATYPVNLRKSFDGLMNEIRSVLGGDPLNGHVYVFINRRKTMVKLIVWTRGGFTILHKRLEQGRFNFPQQLRTDVQSVQIDIHELLMLLEGIEAKPSCTQKRWEPPAHQIKRPLPSTFSA